MFDAPVVYVDIETTGANFSRNRVLEVAAIRVENGVVVREFQQLLNPETSIPHQITQLTGITNNDVVSEPTFSQIADELYEVLDGAIFIAHNVRFDYSFLKHEFALLGISFRPSLLCTVRLSRALYPGHRRHNLQSLIERHGIPVTDRHRALADASAIHYFTQLAYEAHGDTAFKAAVGRQLKMQYTPPYLNDDLIHTLPDTPGVYIFRDENNQPLYIGKSIKLRTRVVSHFQSTHHREVAIAQATKSIDHITTNGELAALLLESKLVKQLLPLHNRKLRRIKKYAMFVKRTVNSYPNIEIVSGVLDETTQLDSVYGLYSTRTKAKKRLDEITRTFSLCPKLMGLEKTAGACFSYSLGMCKGACIQKESAKSYSNRFEIALAQNQLQSWPYGGPIILPLDDSGQSVVIDNWVVQYYTDENGERIYEDIERSFDLDEYKIIRRFIRENSSTIRQIEA